MGACQIKKGVKDCLHVGNLDVKRDWGYAPEYCHGMWEIMQQKNPEDYVLATGSAHSVREFIELAFNELEIKIEWSGSGLNEIGRNIKTGQTIIKVDSKYFRPTEVELLVGDASKAKKRFNWKPKTQLHDLVKIMVSADWDLLNK